MLKISRLLKLASDSRGFSLMEVIIALTICVILVGGLGSITRLSQNIFNGNRQVLTNQQNAYFAMEMLLRDLRAASSITAAQTQLVSFLDTDGNTVTYSLSNGNLQRALTTASGTTTETMANQVTTFNLTYFDTLEQPPGEATAVKRIQIVLQGISANGSQINLINAVRPRNL